MPFRSSSPPYSSTASASPFRPEGPLPPSRAVRLPSIHTWFPSAPTRSSSHLSTPLNQLKIAQPILPSSSYYSNVPHLANDIKLDGWVLCGVQVLCLSSERDRTVSLSLLSDPRAMSLVQARRSTLNASPFMVPSQSGHHHQRLRELASVDSMDDERSPTLHSVASSSTFGSERGSAPTTAGQQRHSLPDQLQEAKRRGSSSGALHQDTPYRHRVTIPSNSTAHSVTAPASTTNTCLTNIFRGAVTRQYLDSGKSKYTFVIDATSHDCFTDIEGKWTCYRRNYLKIDACVRVQPKSEPPSDINRGTSPLSLSRPAPSTSSSSSSSRKRRASSLDDIHTDDSSSTTPYPTRAYATLTAHVADASGKILPGTEEVSLVQFGPEREQGPRSAVEAQRLLVSGPEDLSDGRRAARALSLDAAENWRRRSREDDIWGDVASFRRIQIRRATVNNGRQGGKAEKEQQPEQQQFFVLRISIYAPQDELSKANLSGPSPSPPPSKKARSTDSAAPGRAESDKEENVLLATLDSAPVTIRGRSRKHFAAASAALEKGSDAGSSTAAAAARQS
ncbi:hypothetical protein V8E36_009051 [Tilletia maclaganii]